ncbi:DUF2306 domain-containing protein [Flavobacterium enshiense]|uniref:DUF2306 domain-containing protein n=1 Tax=Flavobacterium enshiense TaxID=1341165 RepID=UPI00345CD5E5
MIDRVLKYSLLLGYGYFSFLLLLITLQYVPLDLDVAFLRIKQEEIAKGYYQIAFFTHVYTSIFLMLFAGFQFFVKLNKENYYWHKLSGRLYVFTILFLSGTSGLIMSYHANGGWIAKTSFLILSVLWIYFTAKSWTCAVKGQIAEHRKYAIRSFALTLSAVSLRLFKYIVVFLFHPPPMDTYRIVAWMGWIFNLLLAEIIIYNKFKK